MRNVMYSESVEKKRDPSSPSESSIYWEVEEQGEAYFHQWGSDCVEGLEGSYGNFTTAIIELRDGRIKSIRAEHIRFIT